MALSTLASIQIVHSSSPSLCCIAVDDEGTSALRDDITVDDKGTSALRDDITVDDEGTSALREDIAVEPTEYLRSPGEYTQHFIHGEEAGERDTVTGTRQQCRVN